MRVSQGAYHALLPLRIDATLAEGCVRVPAGHPATAMLGAQSGRLRIEKIALTAGAAGVAVA